jgi:hypothetical protein
LRYVNIPIPSPYCDGTENPFEKKVCSMNKDPEV